MGSQALCARIWTLLALPPCPGPPVLIYQQGFSDNGSNFVDAEAEVRTYINGRSIKKINDRMLQNNID